VVIERDKNRQPIRPTLTIPTEQLGTLEQYLASLEDQTNSESYLRIAKHLEKVVKSGRNSTRVVHNPELRPQEKLHATNEDPVHILYLFT
jgi:hypothetical protein